MEVKLHEKPSECTTNLDLWFQTVHVMSTITHIAQQNLLWITLLTADATPCVQDGLGPDHRFLERGQVKEHLGKT